MDKIKIDKILDKQFVAAGDTQWANGNVGIDAVYTINRRWLNNFAKLLVEAVLDMAAEKVTHKHKAYDKDFVINKESILKIKEEIDYGNQSE